MALYFNKKLNYLNINIHLFLSNAFLISNILKNSFSNKRKNKLFFILFIFIFYMNINSFKINNP